MVECFNDGGGLNRTRTTLANAFSPNGKNSQGKLSAWSYSSRLIRWKQNSVEGMKKASLFLSIHLSLSLFLSLFLVSSWFLTRGRRSKCRGFALDFNLFPLIICTWNDPSYFFCLSRRQSSGFFSGRINCKKKKKK